VRVNWGEDRWIQLGPEPQWNRCRGAGLEKSGPTPGFAVAQPSDVGVHLRGPEAGALRAAWPPGPLDSQSCRQLRREAGVTPKRPEGDLLIAEQAVFLRCGSPKCRSVASWATLHPHPQRRGDGRILHRLRHCCSLPADPVHCDGPRTYGLRAKGAKGSATGAGSAAMLSRSHLVEAARVWGASFVQAGRGRAGPAGARGQGAVRLEKWS